MLSGYAREPEARSEIAQGSTKDVTNNVPTSLSSHQRHYLKKAVFAKLLCEQQHLLLMFFFVLC